MEDKSVGGSRKTNKTRREAAVQGTNDSSIVSKCSTSTCGYFNDSYLHHFVSKHSRRAPLIHRGYYIRAVAFDRILKSFLNLYGESKKQIISLGCGFDSSFFRLKAAQLLNNTVFCEIDFPELVRRKRLLIENTDVLLSLVERTNEPPLSPHIEFSCTDYHLLGVDLTQLNTLEAALKMCGIDFECPTLLLSECVMTYMTRRCSTELVKWAAETFDNAIFGMYEQINPDDAFGLFMQNHFYSIGSPLKCINSFPSLQSQIKRFLDMGWAWCEAFDMNTFYYNFLPSQEQRRIESLETFDEYEELNLKYSHYFILTASTMSLSRSLLSEGKPVPNTSLYPSISNVLTVTRLKEGDQTLRRFGHSSSVVNDHYAMTTGGFGEIDGRHQRLTEITLTDLDSFKSYHVPCCADDVQYSRMHHASVSLSNGVTFLIGGRQSPYFMCSQMLKIYLHVNAKKHRQCNLESEANIPELYDNSQTSMCNSRNEEPRSKVHVASKKNQSLDTNVQGETEKRNCDLYPCDSMKTARDNCDSSGNSNSQAVPDNSAGNNSQSESSWTFELGRLSVTVISPTGNVPQERWRHAGTAVFVNGTEKIFIHGGKTKTGIVLEDCFLFDPDTSKWEQLSCSGDVPGPRHSHCVSYWNGQVILTGGLNATHEPVDGVFVLDLSRGVWEKLFISGNLYLRYSHTAHLCDDKLLLIGGVNLCHHPPGLAVINLRTRKALEFSLPEQDKSSLLMFHRHTSIKLDVEHIAVLGGGGNCFSFGTHLNRTPFILNVASCIDAVK